MIRIRRLHDDALPLDRLALAEVQQILRERFAGVPQLEPELRFSFRGDRGILFECLRDERDEVESTAELEQNLDRLRFGERWGALPIAGTSYETSVEPGGRGAPFLIFDSTNVRRFFEGLARSSEAA